MWVCVFYALTSRWRIFYFKEGDKYGKAQSNYNRKDKRGAFTLQDSEHGLEACGETPENCMKNLELALKAFEIYDKIKENEEK